MRMSSAIESLIQSDTWSLISGTAGNMPFVLRYRTPVLRPDQVGEFSKLLRCVWVYGPTAGGELPSSEMEMQMQTFEGRLCVAWEASGAAVLTAVLTMDGAKQWVFYSRNVSVCGELLNSMPQEQDPYPIELDAESDPEWAYLRNQVIGHRNEA
jgi:hypothetical protein